jgi:hypothetical protein
MRNVFSVRVEQNKDFPAFIREIKKLLQRSFYWNLNPRTAERLLLIGYRTTRETT